MDLFIAGRVVDDNKIEVPLPSAVILYVLNYCNSRSFPVIFVDDETQDLESSSTIVTYDQSCIKRLDSVLFVDKTDVPDLVLNCALPVIQDGRDQMIRSGLCCVVRHIIQASHTLQSQGGQDEALLDLLGFRGGSLKACSEVSGWTKLCEVELPASISTLINIFRQEDHPQVIEIPEDLMKLELHFEKPPPLHNDDKKKRKLLKEIQKETDDLKANQNNSNTSEVDKESISDKAEVDNKFADESVLDKFFSHREKQLPHGNMYYRVITKEEKEERKFIKAADGSVCKLGCTDNKLVKWCAKCNDREKLRQKLKQEQKNMARLDTAKSINGDLANQEVSENEKIQKELAGLTLSDNVNGDSDACIRTIDELVEYVESLNLYDIDFEHKYAEGVTFTIADLMLFVYVYHLLDSINFKATTLLQRLPFVHKWLRHIVTLPRIQQTATSCEFKMTALAMCLEGRTDCDTNIEYRIPHVSLDVEEDSNEISRRCRGKHKALKNHLAEVLQKVKACGIQPEVGQHPRGQQVQVDWDHVPLGAHPKQELPEKRVARKCEQLENLATAVQAIAKPGDVIVDYCSGGVYLVENKEESLLRARNRVKQLGLTNVIMYQCNLDYFLGPFNIGTCLHACGVATDLVLQQCLDRKSAFVICPCCYGSIQNTHLITYPRSQLYRKSLFTDKEAIVLGHAADQTQDNTPLKIQGQHCMNLVDTDRAHLAKEQGYTVTLCGLQPLSCTPKNNLLIGTPPCNLDYFLGPFNIGTCLHACGVATDLVLQQCLDRKSAFVICPCCYGSIQNTHLITYPRSQLYRKSLFTDKEAIVLGHAADQTQDNTPLKIQGQHCMNLVDTDRAHLAKEQGYTVTLCGLQPLSCTPKNNLLIGTPPVG